MGRLNTETSPTHLPLDLTVGPGQKNGVDPSLIGVFDKALRQAAKPDRELADRRAPEPQTAPATELTRPERAEREADPKAGETRVEDAETEPAGKNAPDPVDEDEVVDDAASEAESTTSDEETKTAEADEEEEASDETPDVVTTELPMIVEAIAEEPVTEEAKQISPEGDEREQTPAEEKAAEFVKKRSEMQPTSELGADAKEGSTAIEVVVEETSVSEPTDGAILPASEEEAKGEKEPSTTPADGGKQNAKSRKKSATGTKTMPEAPEAAGKEPSDLTLETAPKKQTKPLRGEAREAQANPASHVRATPAGEESPSKAVAGSPPEQLQNTSAESAAVAPFAEAAPADLTPTTNTSLQGGAVEAVLPGDGRASTAPNQVPARQDAGKGTAEGVDAAKFVQRVANAFSALGQRSGPVRLKLYPPELGSLRMEITVKHGVLSARVEAETAATRSALVDNLPLLRERLAEQGIKVDRFDVNVSDQSQGGPSERPADGGRNFRGTDRDADSETDAPRTEIESTEPGNERNLNVDGRLDVFI